MRTHRELLCVLALLGSIGQAACDRGDGADPVSPSEIVGLVGVEWSLVELDGRPSGAGAGGLAPTLLLTAQEKHAGGFAGCNRFTGSYVLASERLRFSAVATTRMFCADVMELERRFVAALEATRAYRLTGGRLELVGDHGVVARFEAR